MIFILRAGAVLAVLLMFNVATVEPKAFHKGLKKEVPILVSSLAGGITLISHQDHQTERIWGLHFFSLTGNVI